jgi:hypothetical protein
MLPEVKPEDKNRNRPIIMNAKPALTAAERAWLYGFIITLLNVIATSWAMALDLTPWWIYVVSCILFLAFVVTPPRK